MIDVYHNSKIFYYQELESISITTIVYYRYYRSKKIRKKNILSNKHHYVALLYLCIILHSITTK